jgi:enoyl-CoA hydratase/carnithine racemase
MQPFLKIEREGAVVTAILNRPDSRNTLTETAHMQEFVDLCAHLKGDQHAKVLIITGAGTSFCAGGNVKDMHSRSGMFGGAPAALRDSYRNGIQIIPAALYNLTSRPSRQSTGRQLAPGSIWLACATSASLPIMLSLRRAL